MNERTHYLNGAPIVCPTCGSDDCVATEDPDNLCPRTVALRERIKKLYADPDPDHDTCPTCGQRTDNRP